MTTNACITQIAAVEQVAAPTVERDYVLAHIIAGLGALTYDHGLVFKGGTALRLCFFDQYRYSADLDFSVVEGDLDDAYGVIRDTLNAAIGEIDALYLTDDSPPKIAYQGPLGRERTLKLDIAEDEHVLNTARIGLLERWDDLPPGVQVKAYTLPEIAGEKIRCVMQRLQCRDLFDLSLLCSVMAVSIPATRRTYSCRRPRIKESTQQASRRNTNSDLSNIKNVGRKNSVNTSLARSHILNRRNVTSHAHYVEQGCSDCRFRKE